MKLKSGQAGGRVTENPEIGRKKREGGGGGSRNQRISSLFKLFFPGTNRRKLAVAINKGAEFEMCATRRQLELSLSLFQSSFSNLSLVQVNSFHCFKKESHYIALEILKRVSQRIIFHVCLSVNKAKLSRSFFPLFSRDILVPIQILDFHDFRRGKFEANLSSIYHRKIGFSDEADFPVYISSLISPNTILILQVSVLLTSCYYIAHSYLNEIFLEHPFSSR